MVLIAFISYFRAVDGCMTNYSSGKRSFFFFILIIILIFSPIVLGSSVIYHSLGFVTRGKWPIGLQLAFGYLSIFVLRLDLVGGNSWVESWNSFILLLAFFFLKKKHHHHYNKNMLLFYFLFLTPLLSTRNPLLRSRKG
jgi:hypothetical protein